jgi:hypothetical protein
LMCRSGSRKRKATSAFTDPSPGPRPRMPRRAGDTLKLGFRR